MLRFLSFIALIVAATPAFGAVVDCPLRNPDHPEQVLSGAGNDAGDEVDGVEQRRGDIRHQTQYLEKWRERDTALRCTYRSPQGDHSALILMVPGLLIRCDWLAREVLRPQPVEPGTGGPIDQVYLRIWCTSRP
ncbi:hypothetical protein [Paramagnetospirillum caucaseum]|nr:hypothetical protein [Paramagnetospirillum caucaseum]